MGLTDAGDKSYRNYYRNFRSDTNEARKLHGTNQDGTITPFWANFRDDGDRKLEQNFRNFRSDTNEARKLRGTNQDGTITPFWANFRDDGDRKLYFNRERTLTSAGGASETVQQRNFRSEARR